MSIGERYEIEYSRFFNFRSESTVTSVPAMTRSTRSRLRGTWLSSQTSSAILFLTPHSHDFVLSVSFLGKIHEEHYISKLNFSWPHVSCMSGYPPRGSRAVFVTYKDPNAEIQKFALRFPSTSDVQSFIATLKELLQSPVESGNKSNDKLVSEISSHSDYVPSEEVAYRPIEDWSSAITEYQSIDQLESSFNSEVAQNLYFPQTTIINNDRQNPISPQTTVHNHTVGSFPPSFMSLMSMSSQPNVLGAMPSLSDQADLKLQLMRYLDASSFQDIMGKVEEVMSEIGNDLFM